MGERRHMSKSLANLGRNMSNLSLGTYTKADVLKHLESMLADDKEWMNKYNNLEETPEDNDQFITEGRIEALEIAIEKIKLIGSEVWVCSLN